MQIKTKRRYLYEAAALFTTAKLRQQSSVSDRRMGKVNVYMCIYVHTHRDTYSALQKEKEIMPFETTKMNMDDSYEYYVK